MAWPSSIETTEDIKLWIAAHDAREKALNLCGRLGKLEKCMTQVDAQQVQIDDLLGEMEEQAKCLNKVKIGQAIDRVKVSLIAAAGMALLLLLGRWVVERLSS